MFLLDNCYSDFQSDIRFSFFLFFDDISDKKC